jgi:hypothetical protein
MPPLRFYLRAAASAALVLVTLSASAADYPQPRAKNCCSRFLADETRLLQSIEMPAALMGPAFLSISRVTNCRI